MKYLLLAIATFLAFFLQGRISILDISPDLTVLIVFYVGMRYGAIRGLLIGALIGGLQDGVSFSIIGPNLLGKAIIGYSSAFFISGGLFRWTPMLGVIAVSLLTLLDNSIVFLTRGLFDRLPAASSAALFIAAMQSILNAPAGIYIRPGESGD